MLDLRGVEPRVGERGLRRADRPLDQVGGDLTELRPGELQVEVLRALRGGGDERQVDLRRHRRGELDLRLLGGLVEPLQRHLVRGQVDALVALELRDHPVDDRLVEVVAAEVVVPVRRLDLEDAVAELEHGHVERAAAEVEDEDRLVGAFLVEPVRERSRGRLVDDPEHVEARDLARVLRRLALRVVEVGRNGDHRVGDRLAEIRLGVGLQLLQDHRADLFGGVLVALDLDPRVAVLALRDLVRDDRHLLRDLVPLAADEALDREDRVLRVRHLLALRGRPDEPLTVLRERDDGRRRAAALGVRDHGRLAALEHRHAAVRGAEVDTDCLCHAVCLLRADSSATSENLSVTLSDLTKEPDQDAARDHERRAAEEARADELVPAEQQRREADAPERLRRDERRDDRDAAAVVGLEEAEVGEAEAEARPGRTRVRPRARQPAPRRRAARRRRSGRRRRASPRPRAPARPRCRARDAGRGCRARRR